MAIKGALRPRALARLAFILIFFAVVLYATFFAEWRPRNLADVKADLDLFGVWAPLAAALVQAVGVVFLVPGFLLVVATALLFGRESIWISMLGQNLGALICFYIARFLGRDFLESLLGQRLVVIERVIEEHGFRYLLYLRLLSLVPLPLLNYGPGLVQVQVRHVLLASLIGTAPFIVVWGLFGHSLAGIQDPEQVLEPQFLVPAALLLLLVGAPASTAIVLRRVRLRQRRARSGENRLEAGAPSDVASPVVGSREPGPAGGGRR